MVVAGRSRREEYSEATRNALVTNAVELFTERGFAKTSLDEVATRARVTKGALYHHFANKVALFEAAFDAVEEDAIGRIANHLSGEGPAWEVAKAGLRVFLSICVEPAMRRIVVEEGPSVLGYARWRELEERHSFGLVQQTVTSLIHSGELYPVAVEPTTRLLYGALTAGARYVADSDDPDLSSAEITDLIERIFDGLRPPDRRGD